MNKARRKALDEVISKIEEAKELLETSRRRRKNTGITCRKTSRALRGMRRQTPPWTT